MGMSGYIESDILHQKENQKYHIALLIQKTGIRLYQDQNKLFDLLKAFNLPTVKMDRLRFESGAAMVTNIRITAGAPETRKRLISEGRLVTYGIYFDVNKDVVKPESYGTFKEVAAALNRRVEFVKL